MAHKKEVQDKISLEDILDIDESKQPMRIPHCASVSSLGKYGVIHKLWTINYWGTNQFSRRISTARLVTLKMKSTKLFIENYP